MFIKSRQMKLNAKINRSHRRRRNSFHGARGAILRMESLELRQVMTTAGFAGGVLTITGDDVGLPDVVDDKIIVDVFNNAVRVRDVNEGPGNIAITGGAPAPAAVTRIVINTNGGDDYINLSAVTTNVFTALTQAPVLGVYPVAINTGRQDDIVIGSGAADDVQGDRGNDELHGGAGDDRLDAGGAGNPKGDQLFGDAGNDILLGQAGDDWLEGGAGNDTLNGAGGDDTFVWRSIPFAGEVDTIVDAGGAETATFDGVGYSLTIDLNNNNALGQVVAGTALNPILTIIGLNLVENVIGGSGADTITGTAGVNILQGGSQVDTINAGAGNDIVVGDGSSDTLNGGDGNDTMSGDGYMSAANNGQLAGPTGLDDQGAATVLNEASGLAFGRRNFDTLWSIEDSGNGPRLYANSTSGVSKGWYRLDIALPADSDWEDMAFYADGVTRYLYIADIGDNGDNRANVKIYRVQEPQLPANPNNQFKGVIAAANIQQLTLSYPGGARNAETLMVDPLNGDIHIVNKGGGAINLFSIARANQVWGAVNPNAVATPLQVASDQFNIPIPLPIFHPDAAFGGVPPTSGDISSDGSQIVIMSDREIVRFERRPGQAVRDAILAGGLAEIVDPAQNGKREAIAFDDSSTLPNLYTTSEGLVGPNDVPGQDGKQSAPQQIVKYNILTLESGSDSIHGDADNDVIFGGAADDYLYGGGGNDIIFGDFTNQYAYATPALGYGFGSGNDFLFGEAGDDFLDGGMLNDVIQGGIGADILHGGNGDDSLYATTTVQDSQLGDGFADQLFGEAGTDFLYFRIGEDTGIQ